MPPPDPKPERRIRDPELLRDLHGEWRECCVCGGTYGITLHHVIKRSQGGSDVRDNLVPLCQGPFTEDCHGRLHQGDSEVLVAVARFQAQRRH